jgi:tetratricopeptide (TPR) repeat protein
MEPSISAIAVKNGLIRAGLEAADKDDFEGAVGSFEKVLSIFPGDRDALFYTGFVYSETGQFAAAYDIFKKLISINPGDVEAFIQLGLIFEKDGKYGDALSVYSAAPQYPPAPRLYNSTGRASLGAGKFEAAAACFRKAVELDPSMMEGLSILGITQYLKTGAGAESAPLKPAATEGKNIFGAKFLYDAGLEYMARGMNTKAVKAFSDAAVIEPSYSGAYTALGRICLSLKDYAGAAAWLEKALAAGPAGASVYNTLGLVYDAMGRSDEAVEMYKRAVSLDDVYADTHYKLALYYLERGSADKAAEEFIKQVRINNIGDMAEDSMRRLALMKSEPYESIKKYFSSLPAAASKTAPPSPPEPTAAPETIFIPPAMPHGTPQFQRPVKSENSSYINDYRNLMKEKMSKITARSGGSLNNSGDRLAGALPPPIIPVAEISAGIPPHVADILNDNRGAIRDISLPGRPEENIPGEGTSGLSNDSNEPEEEYEQNAKNRAASEFDSGPAAQPDEIKTPEHRKSRIDYPPAEYPHGAAINTVGAISHIMPVEGAPLAPHMPPAHHNPPSGKVHHAEPDKPPLPPGEEEA